MTDEYADWILDELKSGRKVNEILEQLVSEGVSIPDAGTLIQSAKDELLEGDQWRKTYEFTPEDGSHTGYFRLRTGAEITALGQSSVDREFIELDPTGDKSAGADGGTAYQNAPLDNITEDELSPELIGPNSIVDHLEESNTDSDTPVPGSEHLPILVETDDSAELPSGYERDLFDPNYPGFFEETPADKKISRLADTIPAEFLGNEPLILDTPTNDSTKPSFFRRNSGKILAGSLGLSALVFASTFKIGPGDTVFDLPSKVEEYGELGKLNHAPINALNASDTRSVNDNEVASIPVPIVPPDMEVDLPNRLDVNNLSVNVDLERTVDLPVRLVEGTLHFTPMHGHGIETYLRMVALEKDLGSLSAEKQIELLDTVYSQPDLDIPTNTQAWIREHTKRVILSNSNNGVYNADTSLSGLKDPLKNVIYSGNEISLANVVLLETDSTITTSNDHGILDLDLTHGKVKINIFDSDGTSISTYAQLLSSANLSEFEGLDLETQKKIIKEEYSNKKISSLSGDKLGENARFRKLIIDSNADKLLNVPRAATGEIMYHQTSPENFILPVGTTLEVPLDLDGINDISFPTEGAKGTLEDILGRELEYIELPETAQIVDDYMSLKSLAHIYQNNEVGYVAESNLNEVALNIARKINSGDCTNTLELQINYSSDQLEELATRLYHIADSHGEDSYLTTSQISLATGVSESLTREKNSVLYGMGRAEKIKTDARQRKQEIRFAYLSGESVQDIAKYHNVSSGTVYNHTKDFRDGTIAPDTKEVIAFKELQIS